MDRSCVVFDSEYYDTSFLLGRGINLPALSTTRSPMAKCATARHKILYPERPLPGIVPRKCSLRYSTASKALPETSRTSICSDRCWLMVGFASSACKFSFLSYFYSTHLSRVATLLTGGGGGVGLFQAAFSAGQATRPIYAEFDRPTKAYISGTYGPVS